MKKILFSVLASVFTAAAFAQIPNNSFENWNNNAGYNMPDGWDNLNPMTNSAQVFTCEKGTPGTAGTAYLKLTSKSVSGMGVIPGVAVAGKINPNNFTAVSGFAFAQQPTALTGKWQHMIFGNDDATHQGFIDVQLTHWDANMNARTVVGSAHKTLSGMVMSWGEPASSFTIPITYTNSTMPDSAIIVLSASGSTPTNLDYLWVDNLSFSGNATAIHELNYDAYLSVYPNPCSSMVSFSSEGFHAASTTVRICDVTGKVVLHEAVSTASHLHEVNVSDLPAGMYVLYVQDGEHAKHALFSK